MFPACDDKVATCGKTSSVDAAEGEVSERQDAGFAAAAYHRPPGRMMLRSTSGGAVYERPSLSGGAPMTA